MRKAMINKVIFCVSIFVVFFSTFGFCQVYDKADSVALSITNKRYKSIKDLVTALTRNLETDEDKYRAFYTYITESFTYTYSYIDHKKCLTVKKGSCETISNLYKEMCDISNLKCEKVDGYIRDANRLKGYLVFMRKPTHAWNVIELNNEKVIVDATWGLSKTVSESLNKVIDRGSLDFFFNPSPDLFSLTHYAKNKRWLLTKKTKLEFINQLGLFSDFHKLYESFILFPKELNQREDVIYFSLRNDLTPNNFKISYNDDKKNIYPLQVLHKDSLNFTLSFDISEINRNEYFDLLYYNEEKESLRALLRYRKK
jgi:transglutaminase/protease-like cytokinesis protein 3